MIQWKEIAPSIRSHIEQDDGRVCCYVGMHQVMRDGKTWLAAPRTYLNMLCGAQIDVRVISMCVYYPATTDKPLSCPGCLAKQGLPASEKFLCLMCGRVEAIAKCQKCQVYCCLEYTCQSRHKTGCR